MPASPFSLLIVCLSVCLLGPPVSLSLSIYTDLQGRCLTTGWSPEVRRDGRPVPAVCPSDPGRDRKAKHRYHSWVKGHRPPWLVFRLKDRLSFDDNHQSPRYIFQRVPSSEHPMAATGVCQMAHQHRLGKSEAFRITQKMSNRNKNPVTFYQN